MGFIESSLQPNAVVAADSDIGSGALASLVPEGYAPGVVGFDSTNFNKNYAKDGFVYSKGSGNLFLIGPGTAPGSKVAVRVASGTSAAIVGAAIKYLVYPSTFANPPTNAFTSIAAAIAAANTENAAQRVAIIIMPGSYTETFTVRDGMELFGVGATVQGQAIFAANSGVVITGATPGSPTITVTAGSKTGMTNITVLENDTGAVLLQDSIGLTQLNAVDCVFRSDTSATAAIDGTGASTNSNVSLRNCAVSGTADAVNLQGGGAQGRLHALDCTIIGLVKTKVLTMRNSNSGKVLTSTGAMTLDNCIVDGLSAGNGLNASFCDVLTASSVVGDSNWLHCDCDDTVTFASTGPASHRMNACVLDTTGDGLVIGANDGVAVNACVIKADTGIAASGTGVIDIIGLMPGTGTIAATLGQSSISAHVVRLQTKITPTVGVNEPWPTDNPDRVRLDPTTTTAADSIQELPDSAVCLDGEEKIVRNISGVNFATVTVATGSGDTLFDGSGAGDIVMPPGDYRRFICIRGTGWEVN